MINSSLKVLRAFSGQSMIQKLLKYSADPSFISFALGFPSTDILPSQKLLGIANKVLCNQNSLQYQPPSIELKKIILNLMVQKNINCSIDQIFLTSGAQQGLSLVANLLLSEKKGYVLAEEVAYSGFLQAINPFNPGIITLPVNRDGLDPLALEQTIKDCLKEDKKPCLAYLITEGHNPLGTRINSSNLRKIKDILKYYQIYAIEDDPYGFISYEGSNCKLKSLLPDLTFYVGSFSKILSPSLRVGWVVAPDLKAQSLANLKEGADLNISTLAQQLITLYMNENNFEVHISSIQREYREKRDLMISLLRRNFGELMNFDIPSSGMFIWVSFKNQVDTEKLLEFAIEEKLVYLPGNSFCIDPENKKFKDSIRLCFTFCNINQIEEGVSRLKKAFDKMRWRKHLINEF